MTDLSLNQIIMAIVGLALTFLFGKLATVITAYVKKLNLNIDLTKITEYTKIVEDNVKKIVVALNETIVKEYKKKTEDGKLTKEEGQEILAIAINTIKSTLTEEIIEALSGVYGENLDKWFENTIEYILKKLKDEQNDSEAAQLLNLIQGYEDMNDTEEETTNT